jgi:hypothetical protein
MKVEKQYFITEESAKQEKQYWPDSKVFYDTKLDLWVMLATIKEK